MREGLGLGTSAFAKLSPHFRGFRAISDAGGTTCYCANLKMHLHNITCNFISRHITLLSRAFAREHYYKLFRKSFAASILAFAEPSDINPLTTQYMSGFRCCSGEERDPLAVATNMPKNSIYSTFTYIWSFLTGKCTVNLPVPLGVWDGKSQGFSSLSFSTSQCWSDTMKIRNHHRFGRLGVGRTWFVSCHSGVFMGGCFPVFQTTRQA